MCFSKPTLVWLVIILSLNPGNMSCAAKLTSLNVTVDNCKAVIQIPACQGQCGSEPRWEATHPFIKTFHWFIPLCCALHQQSFHIWLSSFTCRHVGAQRRHTARPTAGGAQVPMLPGAGSREEVCDPAVLWPHDQTARLQTHHRLWVPSLRHPEMKVWGRALKERKQQESFGFSEENLSFLVTVKLSMILTFVTVKKNYRKIQKKLSICVCVCVPIFLFIFCCNQLSKKMLVFLDTHVLLPLFLSTL